MTDKKKDRNLDSEKMDQNEDSQSTEKQEFNAGGNASDYDGGHPKDSQPESENLTKNGESYARRQHGKDEIED